MSPSLSYPLSFNVDITKDADTKYRFDLTATFRHRRICLATLRVDSRDVESDGYPTSHAVDKYTEMLLGELVG